MCSSWHGLGCVHDTQERRYGTIAWTKNSANDIRLSSQGSYSLVEHNTLYSPSDTRFPPRKTRISGGTPRPRGGAANFVNSSKNCAKNKDWGGVLLDYEKGPKRDLNTFIR